MYEVRDYYGDSVAFCDSRESAEALVAGLNEVTIARIEAGGGRAVADHYEAVEVLPMNAEAVAKYIAREKSELAEYLAEWMPNYLAKWHN